MLVLQTRELYSSNSLHHTTTTLWHQMLWQPGTPPHSILQVLQFLQIHSCSWSLLQQHQHPCSWDIIKRRLDPDSL